MDFYQFLAQLLPPPPNKSCSSSSMITRPNESVHCQQTLQRTDQFLSCDRPTKKIGRKSTFTEEQIAILEDCFFSSRCFINRDKRNMLAAQLNIPPKRVAYWFQSRRVKWKKENALKNTSAFPPSTKTTPSQLIQKKEEVIHILPDYHEYRGTYPCQICNKVFKKYMYLEHHFFLHHNCNDFKCQM